MTVLPMFPLGSVLLPGGVLPLHVFEPRYRALVRDCVEPPTSTSSAWCSSSGAARWAAATCGATSAPWPAWCRWPSCDDGRYAVVAVGTRRIRVNAWLPDDPYPLADVDDWPDDDPDDPAGSTRCVAELAPRVRRAAALALELGDPVGRPAAASSATTRCWPRTSSPRWRRWATSTASTCSCAPGPRGPARHCSRDRLDDVEALLQFRLDDG